MLYVRLLFDNLLSLLCNYLNMKKIFIFGLCAFVLLSCAQPKAEQSENTKPKNVPAFSADSAYSYTSAQVAFGPRVPNTDAHKKCALYLAAKLREFGAQVTEQSATLTAFNGDVLQSVNIIGSYNPEAESRVVLFAHWDSRPWCDNDPDPANRSKPVLGANDGASGVGVLLEMARQFGAGKPDIGVDIIFFDAEDYGAPQNHSSQSEEAWCLGTQYWAQSPHVPGYTARYGVLLDMVGAPGATFYKEGYSMYYANSVVDKIWTLAASLGFGSYFRTETIGPITDDHYYMNKIAGIPSVDIIHYRNEGNDSGFGKYWHTVDDTMQNVDKNTLNAVGTTLMHLVYNE